MLASTTIAAIGLLGLGGICFAAVTNGAVAAADPYDELMKQGRAAYEERDFETASQYYGKACSAEAMSSYVPARVAYCNHQLAALSSTRGIETDAEQHYLKAVEAWSSSIQIDGTGPQYAASLCISLMNLGDLYRRQHRLPESEKALARASAIARDLPPRTSRLYPATLSRLGVMYQEMGRYDDALATLNDALQRFGKLSTPAVAEEAFAWNGLGMVQLGSGRQADADASLRKAVSLGVGSLGEDHPETAIYQTNLALALIAQGQFERAEPLLRRAKAVIEKRMGPADAGLGLVLAELSACASGEKKFGMAEEYAQQALAILSRQRQPDSAAVALAQVNLADVYLRTHKLAEAEALLTPAIETERQMVPDTRLLADGLRRLADLRAMQHSWEASIALYREAIGIYEHRLGAGNPALAPALRGYAEALKHCGASKSEVQSIESRAKAAAGFFPRS